MCEHNLSPTPNNKGGNRSRFQDTESWIKKMSANFTSNSSYEKYIIAFRQTQQTATYARRYTWNVHLQVRWKERVEYLSSFHLGLYIFPWNKVKVAPIVSCQSKYFQFRLSFSFVLLVSFLWRLGILLATAICKRNKNGKRHTSRDDHFN